MRRVPLVGLTEHCRDTFIISVSTYSLVSGTGDTVVFDEFSSIKIDLLGEMFPQ